MHKLQMSVSLTSRDCSSIIRGENAGYGSTDSGPDLVMVK